MLEADITTAEVLCWKAVLTQLRCCAGKLFLHLCGDVLVSCHYTAEVLRWESVIIQLRCAGKLSLYSRGVLGSCHYTAEVLCWESVIIQLRCCARKLSLYS